MNAYVPTNTMQGMNPTAFQSPQLHSVPSRIGECVLLLGLDVAQNFPFAIQRIAKGWWVRRLPFRYPVGDSEGCRIVGQKYDSL